jgi:hypothetical protein
MQLHLFKEESQETEYTFHVGQVSAKKKKVNNTDSSGRDYGICSH